LARRSKKTPDWVIPAALVAGAIALFAKAAGAQPAKTPSNVQTATVGNRVYSVARLGQGTYLVSLVSTGGVVETSPVTFTFNQQGPMGEFGDSAKIAQLKTDLNLMQLNFSS
jgi:hypothetical protein